MSDFWFRFFAGFIPAAAVLAAAVLPNREWLFRRRRRG
jgi:hypothetical protein